MLLLNCGFTHVLHVLAIILTTLRPFKELTLLVFQTILSKIDKINREKKKASTVSATKELTINQLKEIVDGLIERVIELSYLFFSVIFSFIFYAITLNIIIYEETECIKMKSNIIFTNK